MCVCTLRGSLGGFPIPGGPCLGEGPFLTPIGSPPGQTPLHCAVLAHNASLQGGYTPVGGSGVGSPTPQDRLRCVELLLQMGADSSSQVQTPQGPPGTPRLSRCPSDPLGSSPRPLCPSKTTVSHLRVPVGWVDLRSWPLGSVGVLGRAGEGGGTPTTPGCPPKTPVSPFRVPMGWVDLSSQALGSLGVPLGRLRRL